jgi:hypothetical protein
MIDDQTLEMGSAQDKFYLRTELIKITGITMNAFEVTQLLKL